MLYYVPMHAPSDPYTTAIGANQQTPVIAMTLSLTTS